MSTNPPTVRSPAPSVAGPSRQAAPPAYVPPAQGLIQGRDDLRIKKYKGSRSELKFFLVQLKTIFTLQPQRFISEEHKVLFAAMQLEDTAFEWFEPTLSDHLESATPVPAT